MREGGGEMDCSLMHSPSPDHRLGGGAVITVPGRAVHGPVAVDDDPRPLLPVLWGGCRGQVRLQPLQLLRHSPAGEEGVEIDLGGVAARGRENDGRGSDSVRDDVCVFVAVDLMKWTGPASQEYQ